MVMAILLCATAVNASAADEKKTAASAPQTLTIPRDAVANPDGVSYTWTDKDGKKWVFAKTPFGIMKSSASDQRADTPVAANATKAIDKGDTVRFERPGPFGTMSWEKKKSDLTDEERSILDAQSAKTEQKSGQPE